MVSNSGTTMIGGLGRVRWAVQPGLLQQQVHLQHVRDALALGDDVGGDAGAAIALVRRGRRVRNGQLRVRLVAVRGDTDWTAAVRWPAPGAAARRARLPSSWQVVASTPAISQQLGDHARMHVGVLPQVERRQMKAAGLDGADQPPQRAAGRQQPRATATQGVRERRPDRRAAPAAWHRARSPAVGAGAPARVAEHCDRSPSSVRRSPVSARR